MIDSISTSSVQGQALRSLPQSNSTSSAAVSVTNPANFVTSRVRVDNLQNVAILEYRSSNGDVVRQYPTQAQIQAFKRAEQLATEHAQTAHTDQPHPEAGDNGTAHQSGGGSSSPAPAPSAQASSSAPVPTTSDIVEAAASSTPVNTGTGDSGGGSTQSVVV